MMKVIIMIKKVIIYVIQKLGYDIIYYRDKENNFPLDFESRHIEIIKKVAPYTLTGPVRIHALIESVQYILRNDIKGDFLECGVYKAGSMMTIALTLMKEGVRDRELYLFDTFDMVPAAGEKDENIHGIPASIRFSKISDSSVNSNVPTASLEEAKQAMALTGYPMDKIHFIKGLVENTIPEKAPKSIALLRLDTDWYQSTIHEMNNLYPKVTPKGILIVDDYGYYKGSREAVDEFFQKNKLMPLLHRIDFSGRLIIKEV